MTTCCCNDHSTGLWLSHWRLPVYILFNWTFQLNFYLRKISENIAYLVASVVSNTAITRTLTVYTGCVGCYTHRFQASEDSLCCTAANVRSISRNAVDLKDNSLPIWDFMYLNLIHTKELYWKNKVLFSISIALGFQFNY